MVEADFYGCQAKTGAFGSAMESPGGRVECVPGVIFARCTQTGPAGLGIGFSGCVARFGGVGSRFVILQASQGLPAPKFGRESAPRCASRHCPKSRLHPAMRRHVYPRPDDRVDDRALTGRSASATFSSSPFAGKGSSGPCPRIFR